MARDEDGMKEGVDFKWVTNKGTNVKTRKFFTKAEKEAMAAKKEAPKKPAAKKEAPKKAKPAEKKASNIGPSDRKGPRAETSKKTSNIGPSDRKGPKKKEKVAEDNVPIRAPAKQTRGPRKPQQTKPYNPSNKPSSTMKPGFQGRYQTGVARAGGTDSLGTMRSLSYGGRGGGMIDQKKNRLKPYE